MSSEQESRKGMPRRALVQGAVAGLGLAALAESDAEAARQLDKEALVKGKEGLKITRL